MKLSDSLKSAVRSARGYRPTGRTLKRFGYSTLFTVLFSFFLFMSLPFNRFIPSLENLLGNSLGRTVRIGDIATTMTGALKVSNLEVGLPEKGDTQSDEGIDGAEASEEAESAAPETAEKRSHVSPMYMFDEVTVNVGMLAALMGKLDVDTHVEGLGGTVDFAYEGALTKKGTDKEKASANNRTSKKKSSSRARRRTSRKSSKSSKDEEDADEDDENSAGSDDENNDSDEPAEDVPTAVHVKVDNVNLKLVHDLRDALPVPISGTLNLAVDIESPSASFEKASGKISFSIENVLLSKKGYEAEIFGSKLAVPSLAISSIKGEIVLEKGEGKVTSFKVTSKHIDITLEGDITLGQTLKKSRADLYAAFKVQDAYLNQSEAIRTIMDSADMFSPAARQAHRDDGYYGFRYKGPFGTGKFSPSKVSDVKDRKSAKKSSRASRSKRRARTTVQKPPPRIENDDEPPDLTDRSPMVPDRAGVPAVSHPPPSPPPPPPVPTPPPPQRLQSPGPPLGHQINRAPVGPRHAGAEASEEEEAEEPADEKVAEEEAAEEEEAPEEEAPEEEADEEEEVPEEEAAEEESAEEEPADEEEAEDENEDEDESPHPPQRPPIDPDDIY